VTTITAEERKRGAWLCVLNAVSCALILAAGLIALGSVACAVGGVGFGWFTALALALRHGGA
jgi:hypothetical protein